MPAAESSLRITEAYRTRLFGLRSQLERRAELLWPTIEGLDDFTWTNKAAAATQNAQREAVALTGAYLTAFLSSEVGTRTRGPILDTRRYSGLSRDGRLLRDALRSPMIGVRFKLKEGATPEEALKFGLDRAKRMVSVDYDHAHRTALLDGLAADERFQGWQRAVTGTCGACAGDIAVEVRTELPSIPLQVHPNCQCVTEPVVVRPGQPRPVAVAALDTARREAVSVYSQVGGQMNTVLRRTGATTDTGDKVTDAIATAGESAPTLYRGVETNVAGDIRVGQTYTDAGFGSATTDRAWLENAFPWDSDERTIFEIHGARALDINKTLGAGSKHPEQKEWLIHRDTRFKVERVTQEGKIRRVVLRYAEE
jgi:hypothetical protein